MAGSGVGGRVGAVVWLGNGTGSVTPGPAVGAAVALGNGAGSVAVGAAVGAAAVDGLIGDAWVGAGVACGLGDATLTVMLRAGASVDWSL